MTVEEVECLAACGGAPAMQVNYEFHEQLTPEAAEEIVEEYSGGFPQGAHDLGSARWLTQTRIVTKRLHDRPDDSWTIAGANATGAYEVLRDVLRKGDAADVQEQVKLSGLRGRGGAGFPAAQKWSFLPPDSFPRYLVVNGDEGEPSTFKDRMLVERDPHQLLEGIAIAAYAIQCNLAFVYLRGEFALGYERLMQAIADAREARASSARTSRDRASTSTSSCTAAPARTSAARRPRCSSRSKVSAACRASVRRSRRSRACTPSRRSSTTSRRCRPCRTSSRWVARSTPSSA